MAQGRGPGLRASREVRGLGLSWSTMANSFILMPVNEASRRPLDTEAQGASWLVTRGVLGGGAPWPSGDTGSHIPAPDPPCAVCIWLFLVCVFYERLCFQSSVGRPYNLGNLWGSWEPLNLELSESGCRWPPEILAGVCSPAA